MMRVYVRLLVANTMLTMGLVSIAMASPTDFTVSSGDKTFRLSDARGKYVALHFLLGGDCATCEKHVAEVARRAPEVAGVVHVFLKPDAESDVLTWNEKLKQLGVQATVFCDPAGKLADEYRIPGGFAYHDQSGHFPALVLLGPDGREVFRHVGRSDADLPTFDQWVERVAAQSKDPSIAAFNLGDGAMALKGYDPVAYIKSNKAQAGKSELVSRYRGVTYRFTSAENRMAFADNPEAYLPAYGGWCATAMADGRKVEIDPTNFKVTNGRLFLFYKGWLGNALNDWSKDERNLTIRADEHWSKLTATDGAERK